MNTLEEYIVKESEAWSKKNKPITWMDNIIENIGKCRVATHVGKFTHSKSKVSIRIFNGFNTNIKYVITESVKCKEDIVYESAAYMAAAKFLDLMLEDGNRVIDHIVNNDMEVQTLVEQYGVNYNILLEKLKMATNLIENSSTESILKQVYFPINERQYHLLTILPNSSVMCELSRRIREMISIRNDARDTKKESDIGQYKEILNRTIIGFGGAQPQNVSVLNSMNVGKYTLLESLPPMIEKRNLRYPKKDFWNETMRYYYVSGIMKELHLNLCNDRNNLTIRNRIKENIHSLIDRVLQMKYKLWSEYPCWIKHDIYGQLPKEQIVWLDLENDMDLNSEMIDTLSKAFSRWLIHTYGRVLKKDSLSLGSEEFRYFAHCMEDVLKKEVMR